MRQFKCVGVLDEIQEVPSLLSYIQVRVDESKRKGEFILTGSHQLSPQYSHFSIFGRPGGDFAFTPFEP